MTDQLRQIILTWGLAFICTIPGAWAQDNAEPQEAIATQEDLSPHIPVIENMGYLGYQTNGFFEVIRDIKANGAVFHTPKIGGIFRMKHTDLKNSYGFFDYTYLSQPVLNQITQNTFTRNTHLLDLGAGYIFAPIKDQLELAPYLGMAAQFNANQTAQADDSVYYHVTQNRVGLGLGSKLAMRWEETLPIPVFLLVDVGWYPFTWSNTASKNANFPEMLQIVHLGFSWFGRYLPYMGTEVGLRQQLHFGGAGTQSFFGAWTEFFVNHRVEPEALIEELKRHGIID